MLKSPAELKTGDRLLWLSLTNGGQRHFCSALFPSLWMLLCPLLVEMEHGIESHHFPPIDVTVSQRHGMRTRFHLAYPWYGAFPLSVGAGRTGSNLNAVWLIKTCCSRGVPRLGRFAQHGRSRGAAALLAGSKHLSQATSLVVEDPALPTVESQRVG